MHRSPPFVLVLATLPVLAVVGLPTAAMAQEIPGVTPVPTPTPAPRTAPTRITPPITYSLPSGSRTPSVPPPQQQAPVAQDVVPVVRPSAVPTPRATATPVPRPAERPATATEQPARPAPTTPVPSDTSDPVLADPVAPIAAEPSPIAVTPPPPAATDTDSSGWPWLLGIAAAMLAAGAVAFARRRSSAASGAAEEVPIAAPEVPEPVEAQPQPPQPVAAPAPLPRPALPAHPRPSVRPTSSIGPTSPILIELHPHRAGMTALEGVIDFSLNIVNRGSARAENMLLSAFLLTANAGQDAEIAELLAAPADPRNHNPFALAPGEGRRLDAGLTIPRGMIHTVPSGDTPVFVPLLVVALRYRSGLTTGKRASAAFLVGRQRAGSDRLGPLPFDGDPRMFDGLAARLHVPVAADPMRLAG